MVVAKVHPCIPFNLGQNVFLRTDEIAPPGIDKRVLIREFIL